jgi:hypothetical protein
MQPILMRLSEPRQKLDTPVSESRRDLARLTRFTNGCHELVLLVSFCLEQAALCYLINIEVSPGITFALPNFKHLVTTAFSGAAKLRQYIFPKSATGGQVLRPFKQDNGSYRALRSSS